MFVGFQALKDAVDTALQLVNARQQARPLAAFPGILPEDLAAAYRCQAGVIGLWPDRIAGWKVARIHASWQPRYAEERLIPMIIGNTRDETIAFLGNEPGVRELDWQNLPARLLPQLYVDIDPGTVIAEYRRLYPQYTPTQVYFAATTAGRSWRGAVIEAQLRAAQGSPAWVYQLDYRSPLENGRYGAMHTMDIPLVFDNVRQPGSLTGDTPEAQRTADQLSAAFIAFARNGDPGRVAGTQWLRYEPERRATMVFDATSTLVDDPRGGERRLFERVPYIQRGTY